MHISNGISENALWASHIVYSVDGVHWQGIPKTDVQVVGVHQAANTSNQLTGGKASTTVTLKRADESVFITFECNNVINQPTWQGLTQAALDIAIADILAWLSSAVSITFVPVVKTPSADTQAGVAGNTNAGVRSFAIANVGAAPGTVDGDNLPVGAVVSFFAGGEGDTLAAMAFDSTGTIFLITYVT